MASALRSITAPLAIISSVRYLDDIGGDNNHLSTMSKTFKRHGRPQVIQKRCLSYSGSRPALLTSLTTHEGCRDPGEEVQGLISHICTDSLRRERRDFFEQRGTNFSTGAFSGFKSSTKEVRAVLKDG